MEKALILTVLAIFAVFGPVASVSSGKYLLRELIRELEDTEVDVPKPAAPSPTPSDVEAELEKIGDLSGMKNDAGDGQTTEDEGSQIGVQDGGERLTEQEGDTTGDSLGEQEGKMGETEHEDDTEEVANGGENTKKPENEAPIVPVVTLVPIVDGGENTKKPENEAPLAPVVDDGENTNEPQNEAPLVPVVDDGANTNEPQNKAPHVPVVDDGANAKKPQNEAPLAPVVDDRPPHSEPSSLEHSAVRLARLFDNLSRMLEMRADSLARIDQVLLEGPEMGYPSVEKLAEKQEKLEIMAAKVVEMKNVLSDFFDEVVDRFDNFVSDDKHDESKDGTHSSMPMIENKPVPTEASLPDKPESADVEQRELLKRLVNILKSDTK